MTGRDIETIRDGLNRVAKLALDDGSAADLETAVANLHGHRIGVLAGPEVLVSAPHQAALLTVVNVARRFALGGVTVEGDLDAPLLVMGDRGRSLREEVEAQGGRPGTVPADAPSVVVGRSVRTPGKGVAVTFEGWRGGVVPLTAPRLAEVTRVMPAAVLAGAFAAAEVFAMLRGEAEAGHRSPGLSLWRPDRANDWRGQGGDGPEPAALPSHLWILGLGHLGQAFLWTLLLCPYRDSAEVTLVLQDTDIVTPSTDSTSVLTEATMVGMAKTRAVAGVLERHGFRTVLVERPFDGDFRRRQADDPPVLVCGVDNALARSQIEGPGFPLVIEAGIGARAQDFRALRLHTFPAARRADDLWRQGAVERDRAASVDRPGYARLSEAGVDPCGLTRLAETAVGAPFVGTVAGTLMVAQLMRLLAGDQVDALVDLDLRSPRSRRAMRNHVLAPFNPGYAALE
jgi:hypothetical protein